LRRIDDQVAPGLEHHLALQRLLDFILDAVQVEDRPLARVMLQTIAQLGHQFADELLDLLEILPRVDADLLDTWVDQVAQRAHGQRQVFIDQRGCAHRLHLPVDLLPQPAQVADVHEYLVTTRTFGSGAQDEATGFLDAFGGDAFGHHLLETLALGLVLDTQGNPDVAGSRHVDQVARRNRQLRGQPCALGADGVLGHLHHQALPIVYQRADGLDRVALAGGNFRGMDEGRALQADVDERRLHAGQHPHHLALVDIADDAAALGTLDVDFLQHTVFHHRHPRLHGGDVHQDLFAHCCSRPMALYGTAEAEGWLDSNGLSARATGSGEPDERDDSSVSVFFHPAGDSRLVEQLRRLA